MAEPKINVCVAGGPGTGKSTIAAALFARLKADGHDYDLVGEEGRKLKREFGGCRSPFDRLYLWRQQEREELRSTAAGGFVTDTPLFLHYVKARLHQAEPRDALAVRELFRMCLEIDGRYDLVVLVENPREYPYRQDGARGRDDASALECHRLCRSFVEHFWHDRLLLVRGTLEERVAQVTERLAALRKMAVVSEA